MTPLRGLLSFLHQATQSHLISILHQPCIPLHQFSPLVQFNYTKTMHHQCTTSLAALLLLLSPTTFAAAMPPSGPVAPMATPVCKSAAIAIAANRAPDCSMARCTDDGKLSLLGAPEQCMKNCECPVPSQGMEANSTPGMGPAPIVKGNPVGTTYTATLPESEKSGIRGFVSGSSGADGLGVDFTIELSGFPDALGPFCKSPVPQPQIWRCRKPN